MNAMKPTTTAAPAASTATFYALIEGRTRSPSGAGPFCTLEAAELAAEKIRRFSVPRIVRVSFGDGASLFDTRPVAGGPWRRVNRESGRLRLFAAWLRLIALNLMRLGAMNRADAPASASRFMESAGQLFEVVSDIERARRVCAAEERRAKKTTKTHH